MVTFLERLLIRLTVCSLCIKSICNFGCFSSQSFSFDFEGGTLVLIVPIPRHYKLPFTFGVN